MSQVRDPVCGRLVEINAAAGRITYGSEELYFCSDDCRNTFEADPKRFEPERHEPPYTVKGGIRRTQVWLRGQRRTRARGHARAARGEARTAEEVIELAFNPEWRRAPDAPPGSRCTGEWRRRTPAGWRG
jgi:YHS domain-containing protein